MNLGTLADPVVADLIDPDTGIPALVISLLPLLAMFVGVRLAPKLIKRFAR